MTERLRPQQKPEVPLDEGRTRERSFDILSTHIPDFFLLVDRGAEPDLLRSDTRALRDMGATYAIRQEAIDVLEQLQEPLRNELVKLGVNNPGLRGGRDAFSGREIQITPKTVDVFDEDLLDESLGDKRPEVVHKKVSVTVELDPDTEDVEGFIKSVKRRLRRQGLSYREAEDRAKIKRTIRVDEKTLQKMVEAEDVVLIPGAWGFSIKHWDVFPRRNKSKQELAEAEEAARTPKTS